MSIPKWKDFEDYNNYPSESNPTSNAQMQEFMKNQNELVKEVASMLWQPQTAYVAGQFVFSENIPKGAFAVCTTAGTTGTTEPSWSAVGSNTNDSGVVWNIRKLNSDYNALVNKPTALKNPQSLTLKVNGESKAVYDGSTSKSVDINVVATVNGEGPDENGNVDMSGLSVGMIIPYANNGPIPEGFLLCNGASVLRATYPDLFDAIGTTFGATDNAHFNLPDLRQRFIEGGDSTGGYKEAGLPNITAKTVHAGDAGNYDWGEGAFRGIEQGQRGVCTASSSKFNIYKNIDFDASRSNSIYGNSDTVQPKSITVRYIIKAFGGLDLEQEDIQVTQIMNEINRIDAKLNDMGISGAIDVAVEYGGDENLWYRKYASGWLEQGGMYYQSSATRELNHIFTLLKPFRNNLYTVSVTAGDERATNNAWSFSTGSNCLSNTSFLAHVYGIGSSDVAKRINFYACGMGVNE